MSLVEDTHTGRVSSNGKPKWRATMAAVRRIKGHSIEWTIRPRRAHVAHLTNGTRIAVLRNHPSSRRWSAVIDGFEFWEHSRVLGRELFSPVLGFDRVADATRFVNTILKQAGAVLSK